MPDPQIPGLPSLAVAPPPAAPATPVAPPTTLRDYLVQQAEQYKVDPRFALAILNRESSGGVHARNGQITTSPQGARGMFQLLPGTAAAYGLNADDPFENIQAGVRNLREALDHNHNDVEAAARYYHGGSDLRQHGPITRAYGRAVAAELRGQLEAEANQPPPEPPPPFFSGATDPNQPAQDAPWTGLGSSIPPPPPPGEESQLYGLAAEAGQSLLPIWEGIKAIPSIPEKARQLPDLAQRIYQDPSGMADAAWQGVKRIGAGIQRSQTDLWNQGTAMEDEAARMADPANPNRAAQSQAAYLRGLEGRMRKSAAMIPLLGPIAARAQDYYGQGKWGRGTGSLVDLGVQAYALKGPKGASVTIPAVFPQKLNAAEKSAVEAAQAAGIPMDVATASGNRFAMTAQQVAESTLFGAGRAQDVALERGRLIPQWGEDLATQVHPRVATPLSAGEDVTAGVQAYIDQRHARANRFYSKFRAIEADPANTRQVQIGMSNQWTPQGTVVPLPIMGPMQLPVDLGAIKPQLRALYDSMTRGMDLTRQQANPGLHVLKQLIEGPDFRSASAAEIDLGTIKSLARTKSAAGVKDISQGLASKGVQALQDAIDTAVASAGPDAQAALQRGRAASRAEHRAEEVFSKLSGAPVAGETGEDVGVFRKLVQPGDASLKRLRQVQQLAPQEIPKVGRAVLDDIFRVSKAEGGWGRSGRAFQQWQNLGPETKAILYTPEHIQALDDFFLAAKMFERTTNPSGTARASFAIGSALGAIYDPLIGGASLAGAGLFTKLMHSPLGVQLLTQGIQIPAGSIRAAAWTAAVERLLREERARAEARGEPPAFPPGPITSVVGAPPPAPPAPPR